MGPIRPSKKVNFFNVGTIDLSFDDSLYATNILVNDQEDINRVTKALKRNRELPEIIFNKVSPSNYEIKIKKYKGPFLMEFYNSYNPNWNMKIKIDDKIEQLNEKNYFTEMLGTSAFLIDLGDKNHDLVEISLEYKIKNYLTMFVLSLVVSVITLLIVLMKRK